jgi:imidazolonepropionase
MQQPQAIPPRRTVETPFVLKNASELCVPDANGAGIARHAGFALAAIAGRVEWLGPQTDLPDRYASFEVIDAAGGAVVPAMVDSHTHLVYGGDRVLDFCRRARGMSYAEIAAEGGGIHTTVNATRSASTESLRDLTRARLERREANGIGTTEIKSGYGLSIDQELRILRVAGDLRSEGFDLETTLLAAHTVPKDTARDEYVRQIVEVMIPRVAAEKLARFVDVFVEKSAFTLEEGRLIFRTAHAHGLIPRIHADQLTAGGGAELAGEARAASADHLEHTGEAGLQALRDGGVVATLLPGAMTYLGDDAGKLGRRLIDAGVEVSVATDQNPGSSPISSLSMMATLAVTRMGLTAEEALRAITLGAAHALRRDDIGTLVPGARARFLILAHADARALVASYGEPIIARVVLS